MWFDLDEKDFTNSLGLARGYRRKATRLRVALLPVFPSSVMSISTLRKSGAFGRQCGTACGLCAKRTFCPLLTRMAAEYNSAGRTDLEVYSVPAERRRRAPIRLRSGQALCSQSLQSQIANLQSKINGPGWRNWQTRQT